MPTDGVMRQSPRGFRQDHGEGDECERLPKFGNLIPGEQSKEGRACGGKETANDALLGVVAVQRELCCEIKHRAENGQSQ